MSHVDEQTHLKSCLVKSVIENRARDLEKSARELGDMIAVNGKSVFTRYDLNATRLYLQRAIEDLDRMLNHAS